MTAKEIGQELAELRRLGRLAKDLDQLDKTAVRVSDLESGFYFNRHVGAVKPLTGAASEQAEVRSDGQQGNAYGACPNGAGLYGLLGNARGMNPDGAHFNGEQSSLSDAQMLEVDNVPQGQTSERTIRTLCPMRRSKRDNSGCREGSAIESELQAILQDTPLCVEVRQHNEHGPDNDELDMQRWRARTDANAKAGTTRHSPRQRYSADAKVSSTQHPLLKSSIGYRSNLNELPSCKRISCLSNEQGPEKSRSTKPKQQKRRQDRAESRRRRKQSRRLEDQSITKVYSDQAANTIEHNI